VENKFGAALKAGEALEFFCGSGKYFSPDPDWGDHLPIRNWQDLCAYLREEEDPFSILSEQFCRYVDLLAFNYASADGMLMNVDAYYYLRKKNAFMQGGDLLQDVGEVRRQKIGKLFRLLRSEFSKENQGRKVVPLDQWLERIRDNGCGYDLEKL